MSVLSHDDLDQLITKIHDNSGEALADISEDLQALRADSYARETENEELAKANAELTKSKAKLVEANSGLFAELGQQQETTKNTAEKQAEKVQSDLDINKMLAK